MYLEDIPLPAGVVEVEIDGPGKPASELAAAAPPSRPPVSRSSRPRLSSTPGSPMELGPEILAGFDDPSSDD